MCFLSFILLLWLLLVPLFGCIKSMGLQNDPTTISTIFPVCDLESGKQIHTYITKSNLSLVISVCNALINMYSRYGCIGTAYFVFSNMVSRDLVSWNTMIDLVDGGFSKAPVWCFLLVLRVYFCWHSHFPAYRFIYFLLKKI